jgi:lipopolysaccharide export system protein LptA
MMAKQKTNLAHAASVLAAVILVSSPQAFAEKADRAKPVEITFARAQSDINQNITTVDGDVVLTQGTLRITAERMRVKRDTRENLTAEIFGAANQQLKFREKRDGSEEFIEGVADRAEFDQNANTLKLFSRAVINSAGNVLTGEYLVYNRVTDQFEITGAAPSGKPGEAPKQTGRGSMIIQPPKDGANSSSEKK